MKNVKCSRCKNETSNYRCEKSGGMRIRICQSCIEFIENIKKPKNPKEPIIDITKAFSLFRKNS